MKPLKAHYTEAVLYIARSIPWIFPKWLRNVSINYSRENQDSLKHLYEKDNKLKTASLLDGEFIWKAVSIVTRIDHEELKLIHKWLKNKTSPGNYNASLDANSFSTKYDHGGGFRNLGWIQLNQEDRIAVLPQNQWVDFRQWGSKQLPG
jgi:hypothetical protein